VKALAALAGALAFLLAPQQAGSGTYRAADYVTRGLLCIHRYEGAWTANTGNGYYGGLQMDISFQRSYGGAYFRRWGYAHHWPVWAQLQAGRNGYRARGWYPWPNTARMCGLI